MSDKAAEKPKTQDVSEQPVVRDAIEARAFDIFRQLTSGQTNGFTHEHMALEAYRRATAFQAVTDKVRAGQLSCVTQLPTAREMVSVKMQRAKNDGTGFVDVTDPNTGEPIIKKFPADPHAYCPNAPLDHPANQRFRPEDGVSLQDRIQIHRKSMAVGVN